MNAHRKIRCFPHRLGAASRLLLLCLLLQGLQTAGWLPHAQPLWLDSARADDDGDDGDDDDGGSTAGPAATSRAPGSSGSRLGTSRGVSASPASTAGAASASSGRSEGARQSGGGGPDPGVGRADAPLRVDGGTFVVDELLAVNPTAAALRRAQTWGATVLEDRQYDSLGVRVVRLRLPPGLDARSASDLAAERDPGVFELHRLYTLEQGDDEAGCTGPACEPLLRMGWPASPARCGSNQRIGVVDTEVATGHPMLRGASLTVRRFLAPGQTPADEAHGTAVAVILAGQPDKGYAGLVPQGHLFAAAPFFVQPSGATTTDAASLVKSLDWLVGQGVRVIGMSLSGPPSLALTAAVQQAQQRGVLVAAAAGNGGPQGGPVHPAALDGVLGVTALGSSNRIYWRASQGEHVDYALPGVDIQVPDEQGTLRPRSGTSYAVPFLVAQVSQSLHERRLRPVDWRDGRAVPATDLGTPGRDPMFGWGLPQVNVVCR